MLLLVTFLEGIAYIDEELPRLVERLIPKCGILIWDRWSILLYDKLALVLVLQSTPQAHGLRFV